MNQTPPADLSGPAWRFVCLLRDFGHLDDEGMARLLLVAGEEAEAEGLDQVDLSAIRAVSARFLFDRDGVDMAEGSTLLTQDWPLLFS